MQTLTLFPLGIEHYLVGGLLIGAGLGFIFLTTGIVVGASSFFSTTLSWISAAPGLQLPEHLASRTWRVVFTIGLILGAAVYTLFWNDGHTFVTGVAAWRLGLGGFLVGLGTRMSRGCTSGHGICGLSSGSAPSLLAVVTFMGVAIATASLAARFGVAP